MFIKSRKAGQRHREHAVRVFYLLLLAIPVCGVGPVEPIRLPECPGNRWHGACGRRSHHSRTLRREGALRDGMRFVRLIRQRSAVNSSEYLEYALAVAE